MPEKEDPTTRHRMVVEEIEVSPKPEVIEKPVESPEPVTPPATEEVAVAPEKEIIAPEIPEPKEKKPMSPIFWIIIPGIFILGAILGGIIFYQKGVNKIAVEATPTSTASAQVTNQPSSSPSATIDISKYDVGIFNGSGIAGEAGKAKTLLETAGFSVISTGNAATYDYTKTIIKAKSTIEASVIQKLKDTLSKNYIVGENQTLATSSTTDIQVVVGSSKAE
jgi:outer membrane biosynthesis protein TonB